MPDLLLLGIVIALEPLPIIGFILVVGTERGARNGLGFIAGWLACLLVVMVGVLALTGGTPIKTDSAPSTASSVANLVLGLGLVGFGFYRRRHPHEGPQGEPAWAKRLDTMGPGGAAVIAVLLQPWALVAAGGLSILQADLSEATSVVELVLFVLLATSVLIIMETYLLRAPDRAREQLTALRSWIDRHREPAIVYLSLGVGVYLVGKGALALW